jgi:hypothetical protein
VSEWQRSIHLGKRDANESAIRRVVEEEFRGKFVPVSIKDGWDAIVGVAGVTELWEIKNGKGRISPGQKRWAEAWPGGPAAFVHTEAQARKRCRMILDRLPTLSTVLRAEHEARESVKAGPWQGPREEEA